MGESRAGVKKNGAVSRGHRHRLKWVEDEGN